MTLVATTPTPTSSGFVHIVGAGPGPLDLMTLRALDRLRSAEVVVHDRLISAEVLAQIPPAAVRVYVGKALGDHAVPQEDIHDLLVAHALQGKRVVRLKGGDPFVFGRGGEEVQALQAAGIAFEVVPGVTAASGCSAAAGIPLTHRDLASSCVFLPGHLAGDSDQTDWAALARPGQTRVFYMGTQRLALIAEQLIRHGLPPDTPAAIVRDGTRATQEVFACSLRRLAEQAPAYGPRPGLLIIGETVQLCPEFQPDVAGRQPRAPSNADNFSAAERHAVYRAIFERRDMRHFAGGTLAPEVMRRLLTAAHHAPSVGFMQPWRFVRVASRALRTQLHALVEQERVLTAEALGERADSFMQLKVEGLLECAELWAVALADGREAHVFGRRTLPQMDLASAACAIQNLWLAARAEGLGVGWVSMFNPAAVARLLQMPAGAEPIALLSIGPVPAFYDEPMLQQQRWAQRCPLDNLLFEERWGQPLAASGIHNL